MKKLIILFLAILLIPAPLNALGIAPGLYEVNYIPGKTYTASFSILGSGTFNISLQGDPDMVTNAQLSREGLIEITDKNKDVEVTFVMPEFSTPGKHTLKVLVSQVPPSRYGRPSGFAALVAVAGQVITRVPYPDKYLVARIFADDAALGAKTFFDVEVYNRGSKVIDATSGRVDIVDPNNNIIDTIPLTALSGFAPGKTDRIYAEWTPISQSPGVYVANATVNYDENTTHSSIRFLLGDMLMEILEIGIPEINQGDIAKISVIGQNKWNQELQAFATLKIEENEIQSPTINLGPWRSETFPLFLDTNTLTTGAHTAQVKLHYQDKTTEQTTTIEIKEPSEIPEKTTSFTLSNYFDQIIIAVLVGLIITIFIAIQKKQKSSKQIYKYQYRR
jgi:hypothetical protein